MDLVFNSSRTGASSSCTPLAGALVNVWQCDALGQYSDEKDNSQGFDPRGQKVLRGYLKIRGDSEQGRELTSQLYFDDALTESHSI